MNYTHRHTITSALSTLAKLEAEANATSERAEKARAMLEDTNFHGSPEVRDFPTLRQAITQGTSTTTAPFKTALNAITHTADGLRLKRTDEPARVVDVCAYLQGVPECFYKIQNKAKPVYNIVVYNSFAWFITAEQIANRAAAIVALAKQLKATGASVALEIAYDCRNTRTDERARVRIPYSLDGLNLGQFAFAISPTFFRTFCLMLDESTFNYWDNVTRASSHTQGTDTTTDADKINLPDFYNDDSTSAKRRRDARRNDYQRQFETKYGTPERAFATVKAQFEAEILRLKNHK